MAEKFLMPKLSPTMEEGQISRWVKNEGDTYEANETLAEVDTDKATMEMTALQGGTLLKILKQAGDTAALREAIAITGKKGDDISALLKEVGGKVVAAVDNAMTKEKAKEPELEKASAPKSAPPAAAGGSTATTSTQGNGRLIVSPIAARMAADNGIDLRTVSGSGPNGRIIKRDIEEALESGTQRPKAKDQKPFTPSTIVGASAFSDEPTSKIRQVI